MPGRKSKVAGTNFESRTVAALNEAGYKAERTTSSLQSRGQIGHDVDLADPRLKLECKFAGHRRNTKSIRIDLADLDDAVAKGADFLVVNSSQGQVMLAYLLPGVKAIQKAQPYGSSPIVGRGSGLG